MGKSDPKNILYEATHIFFRQKLATMWEKWKTMYEIPELNQMYNL